MTLPKEKAATKRTFLIPLISIIIAAALGLGVLGIQYYSTARSNRNLTDKLNSQQNENKKLSEQNASAEKTLSELNSKLNNLEKTVAEQTKTISDLNNKNNSLTKEVSSLKGMKAEKSKENVPKDLSYYKSKNTGPKVCYLTFDDGPSDNTLKILNVLKSGNAKATFFVVGNAKTQYIKNISSEGHAIGLHTNTHLWSIYKSENSYYNDLFALRDAVKKLTNKEINIIRFPGGSSNAKSRSYNKGIMTRLTKTIQSKGFYFFDWNVDSLDASGNNVSVKKIINNIKKESKGKNEVCILMHDTSSKKTTVEALPYVISYLRSVGFRFEVLTEKSNGFHHNHLNN